MQILQFSERDKYLRCRQMLPSAFIGYIHIIGFRLQMKHMLGFRQQDLVFIFKSYIIIMFSLCLCCVQCDGRLDNLEARL